MIKTNHPKYKSLSIDQLLTMESTKCLCEKITIIDNIKFFIPVNPISENNILIFDIAEQFIDYMNLHQYKEIEKNDQEYIINYNEFKNSYYIIFPNMVSNLYDIGLFVQEFSIMYNYNTFIDFTYYNDTIIYVPIPLQLISKKNKKDFYLIMLYKRNNQNIFNEIYKKPIIDYYKKSKFFELSEKEIYNKKILELSLLQSIQSSVKTIEFNSINNLN